MNNGIHLRRLTRADVAFADSLRAQAGWNQTTADWERFLKMEPDGCFLAEWDGAPAGTAMTISYGTDLAWIGMVLVHPGQRRRGIGSALLQECIRHLRERGVRCIKLDATPLGKPVYDNLGFKDEWSLTRWERNGLPAVSVSTDANSCLRNWRAGDSDFIEEIDNVAFGVSRRRLLAELTKQTCGAVVAKSETGGPVGYGLLRRGARALYLGPVVAPAWDMGLRIIESLVTRGGGRTEERMFWDIPDQNPAAAAWAAEHGFTVQRTLTRMYLGENATPGVPQTVFGIAAPEIG